MLTRLFLLLICITVPGSTGLQGQEAAIERRSAPGELTYTASKAGCRLSWTIRIEAEPDIVAHRADCGLPLHDQAPLIRGLLRNLLDAGGGPPTLRKISWGRLYPDGARDATLSLRLALAAKRSGDWDSTQGRPRAGDINAWVRDAANRAAIYEEVRTIFADSGLELRLATVEKVLVQRAEQLPFFESMRRAGTRPSDKLPFDCQAWFSVAPASVKMQPR